MNYKKIGFIGGGRIVRIILSGFKRKNALPESILVVECDEKARERLKNVVSVKFVSEISELKKCEIIFLSIHTPVMKEVLAKMKDTISSETIIVSFAPKMKIEQIQESLKGHKKIVRMNPNAPSIVNSGFNPVVFSFGISDKEKKEFLGFMGNLGISPVSEENKLEKYAIISAMGPIYLFFQLYKLIEIAKNFGLSENEAKNAVLSMTTGSAKVIGESGLTPKEVMDLIPSNPLSEDEEMIKEIYEKKLNAICRKLCQDT